MTNNNGPVRLLLNGTNAPAGSRAATPGASGAAMHWLEVALRAPQGNRFGIGARVGVLRAGTPALWRRARSDGSYLSASDSRVHFGLGDNARVDEVVVEWPDGMIESFAPVQPDRIVTLNRGEGKQQGPKKQPHQ